MINAKLDTKKRTWYAIRLPNDGHYNNGWLSETTDTLQEAKEVIDKNNDFAESKGFEKDDYMITRVDWEKSMRNGVFVEEVKIETFVVIYGKKGE